MVKRVLFFFATGGFAGNFVLSLTDHAVNGFFHRSEWIPLISSALAVGSFLVYLLGNPARSYSRWCVAVPVLQAIVGSTGFLHHLSADLHGRSRSLFSNVISGAPPLLPCGFPISRFSVFALGRLQSTNGRSQLASGGVAASPLHQLQNAGERLYTLSSG